LKDSDPGSCIILNVFLSERSHTWRDQDMENLNSRGSLNKVCRYTWESSPTCVPDYKCVVWRALQ